MSPEAILIVGAVGFCSLLVLFVAVAAAIAEHELEDHHARRELARAQEVVRVVDTGIAADAEAFLADQVAR